MAAFAMCAACRAEYDDPANRRFHAQPTACPACGPRLQLLDRTGAAASRCDDPLVVFAAALLDGKIGALKGLGGYHLACVGRPRAAVAELRRRKHRDEKPFAVMVADLAAARESVRGFAREEATAASRRAGRSSCCAANRATPVAAGSRAAEIPGSGVMLPYTPLHHLLLREPAGDPLVMTSGNRSDEPIAYRDETRWRGWPASPTSS